MWQFVAIGQQAQTCTLTQKGVNSHVKCICDYHLLFLLLAAIRLSQVKVCMVF